MNIVSIDNMTEEAGYDNLTSFFVELNAEPPGPTKRLLIAMLPEYDDAGTLKRIDCITVPTEDPGSLSGGLEALMEGAAQITADRRRAYDIAAAQEREPTVVDARPTK